MAAGAPPLRERARNAVERMRGLVRARGAVRGLALAVFPALLWRARVHLLAVYRHPGGEGALPASAPLAEKAAAWEDFTEADRSALREHGGDALLARFRLRLSQGDWAALTRSEGALVGCCWVHEVSTYLPAGESRAALLQDALTVPRSRGGGLFPRTLAFVVSRLQRDRPEIGRASCRERVEVSVAA